MIDMTKRKSLSDPVMNGVIVEKAGAFVEPRNDDDGTGILASTSCESGTDSVQVAL